MALKQPTNFLNSESLCRGPYASGQFVFHFLSVPSLVRASRVLKHWIFFRRCENSFLGTKLVIVFKPSFFGEDQFSPSSLTHTNAFRGNLNENLKPIYGRFRGNFAFSNYFDVIFIRRFFVEKRRL